MCYPRMFGVKNVVSLGFWEDSITSSYHGEEVWVNMWVYFSDVIGENRFHNCVCEFSSNVNKGNCCGSCM